MLSRLFPLPNKGANQNSSPEKAHESMANEKKPTTPDQPPKPSFLSPFAIMYGCPFLLGNLPSTDLASLADNIPYLNLLQELLREHADQILPHPSEGPVTISVKPGDLVFLKDLRPSPLGPQWTRSYLVIVTTPTIVKLNGIPQWQHLSRIKHCPRTSDPSTTEKDEYCWAPCS
jgi:hypothetical protein